MKTFFQEKKALAWAGCRKGNSTFYISCDNKVEEPAHPRPSGASAERHSFLQYAMLHFRDSHIPSGRESVSTKFMTWRKNRHASEWTWKELTDKVKYSPFPIVSSLLKLESDYLNRLAVDSFKAIMRYMGDLPMGLHQREVECVYTILVMCHHHPALRDETVCQLMKQTTNNKSLNPDSKIRGWRLLSFLLSFFKCSDSLMPYLKKYLKSAAQDCRRIEKNTAKVCLLNLHQTITYGGRRNVPTESEVCAVTAGQLNKEQNYFLPGGVQVVLSTSSSTVVGDVVKSICQVMGISEESKIMEFSLYCIVEGDEYTLPLERDEYVLDLTAELQRNGHHYYLVFCRSLWYHDLRLDSELYIEIVFQQILPDYIEGYLVILPHHLTPENWEEINRIAYILHRAHGMDIPPTERDLKHLVPKPVLSRKHPELDRNVWDQVTVLTTTEAKAQFLEILQKWTLFGSCFFAVKMLEYNLEKEYIVAVNKSGINILHFETHEILWRFSFSAARSLPSSTTDEAEIELGDSHFKKIIRLQVDHANEISRLIKQYVSVQEPSDLSYPKVMIKV